MKQSINTPNKPICPLIQQVLSRKGGVMAGGGEEQEATGSSQSTGVASGDMERKRRQLGRRWRRREGQGFLKPQCGPHVSHCPMSLSRFLLCPPCTHLIALNSVPTNSCLGPSQLVTLPGFLPTYFFIPSLLKTQCGSVSSQFLPLLSPLLPILPQSPSPAVPEKLL